MAWRHTSSCGAISIGKAGQMHPARKGISQPALSAYGPVKTGTSPCTKVHGTLLNLHIKNSKFLPRQWRIGRRLSPFPVALGHTSANAVKATVGGWSTGSSACLTFPLNSFMSSARQEGGEYHF